MKHVLIVIGNLTIGGSRSSLSSLLSVIDTSKVKVDLFVREHTGSLQNSISNCRVLPENIWLSHRIHERNIIKKIICYFLYIFRALMQKIGFDMFRLYNYIGGNLIGSPKYDAVIGFDETLTRFVSYLPAKKRITWLHCDYHRYVNNSDEAKYFKKIDNVVCVSKFAKDSFIDILPQFEYKTVVIRNAINVTNVIEKSKVITRDVENVFNRENIFTLISIGRYDPVKQFDRIPSIASEVKHLLGNSKTFQWLILGGGNDVVKKDIESEIEKYQVNEEVKLMGMQSNPYPYLAKSNLYVCTSSSETFSYTIHEGLALSIPFVCNDFPCASESIDVGKDGFILPLSEMPQKIVELINNPLQINGCRISNEQLLKDFYNII